MVAPVWNPMQRPAHTLVVMERSHEAPVGWPALGVETQTAVRGSQRPPGHCPSDPQVGTQAPSLEALGAQRTSSRARHLTAGRGLKRPATLVMGGPNPQGRVQRPGWPASPSLR